MEIMDIDKNKPSSPNRRLRLRKNIESIDAKTYNNSNNENKKKDTAQSPCDDDSICDFKSPKRNNTVQTKIITSSRQVNKSKKKVLGTKSNVINNKRKIEERGNKSHQNKKIQHVQQPSIESSFFKSEKKEIDSPQTSTNVKTAYVCPLCFKHFKDESLQTIHMKSCAVKNNVSTKTLMDAMEMQERQAAERKSLGLLSAPVLQDKKKPVSRKMTSHDDPDLQLALALSKSLYEKEEMEEWDEVQIVAISSNSSLPDSNAEHLQKATLQSFGFTSSRNISPTKSGPTNKIRKRKPVAPTILQRRTAAEKERILAERIAEILMEYKDFTQRSQEELTNNIKEKIVLKNQLLQQLHQTENTLWGRTRLTSTQEIFYVKQLSSHIAPLEKKEQKLSEEQNVEKLMGQNIDNKTLDNEQIVIMKEIKAVKLTDNNEELISSNITKTCCKEKTFLDILATSWKNMLNDSSASDIIIFVKNARHIWAHKLVFYARCTNILLNVTSNDTEFSTAKEKICWIDVDYDVASAFLEFIYCGIINEHSKIFSSDTLLSDIRLLARKYKVNDLFVYLRQKEFKFKSNITEIKHETCRKRIDNLYADTEKDLNISKSFNVSPNHTRDDSKNIRCSQRMLLQKNVNDNLHSLENNYISAKDFCVLQDEKSASIRVSDAINSRSNTPNWEISNASPDLFDDTPDMMKPKFPEYSNSQEDSDIHILLNLIKQDKDADICSQTSLTEKRQSAKYSESNKDISINLSLEKNVKQNVVEIDSDSESNYRKSFIDKNSLIDTPQSSKTKSIQDLSSKFTKQKSNLTLFIEEMQKQNATLDLDLDSDIEYRAETSPIRYKNPFHINRHDNSEDFQSYNDNVEQSVDAEKKPGRLSIIEQRMRSYADKNPEFYSHLSNKDVDIKQTSTLHIQDDNVPISKMSMDSSCNNTQSFTLPSAKDVNISQQITVTTPLSVACSPHIKTATELLNDTVLDVETDEEEISMYSKYMKDHKENSIANYRAAVRETKLNDSLSNKNTSSDSISKNSDINDTEDNTLNKSVLTQKDADIIVSSDTEVESISSSASHPIVSKKDDSDHEDIMPHSMQQSKRTEYNKQGIEKNNQLVRDTTRAVITDLEEEKDFNSSTRERFNASNTEIASDNIDCNLFMRKKFGFNESSDDQKEKSISNPIVIPSSPEFVNTEDLFLEHFDESISETNIRESRRSDKFSLNFEDEIFLANVNIDMYGRSVLEKSQSTSVLNKTEFKKDSTSRCNNKNNDENIRVNNATMNNDIIPVYKNLDKNAISLTQNFASVRKFQRKSLSEGQINLNNRETSTHASVQFKYNYSGNISNTKPTLKIVEKDVTPPPDYNGMKTPELHKKMKKYGLKAQKRSRAVKLLTHIYNELHPLVPTTEITSVQEVTEISSDEDESPPPKKRHVDNNSLEKSSNTEDSDDKLFCSQNSDSDISDSEKDPIGKEIELSETESLPENPSNITEAFTGLLDIDKNLHNKILQYEPVNVKELHQTLRSNGFKCKLSKLVDFLDEQSITFYIPEQRKNARTRRKA